MAVAADVRDPAAVDDVVARTVETFGRLDIVVNGAAGNFLCLAEDLSPNGFGAVVDIDLKGTFHVSKAAFPHLKAHGGTVLNISATLPALPGFSSPAACLRGQGGSGRTDARAGGREGGRTVYASTGSPRAWSRIPKGFGGWSPVLRRTVYAERHRSVVLGRFGTSATPPCFCVPTWHRTSPA